LKVTATGAGGALSSSMEAQAVTAKSTKPAKRRDSFMGDLLRERYRHAPSGRERREGIER
jgi:hypothetical protein